MFLFKFLIISAYSKNSSSQLQTKHCLILKCELLFRSTTHFWYIHYCNSLKWFIPKTVGHSVSSTTCGNVSSCLFTRRLIANVITGKPHTLATSLRKMIFSIAVITRICTHRGNREKRFARATLIVGLH